VGEGGLNRKEGKKKEKKREKRKAMGDYFLHAGIIPISKKWQESLE
jgi:hypothetical protein